jgi:hypothetical protein
MNNPERLTILVKNNVKQEKVLSKIQMILGNLGIAEKYFRLYVDSGAKTVIHIVIDSKYSDDFIFEALNQQINFVATNSKVRRILDILSMDYQEVIFDESFNKKKPELNEKENDEEYEDFDLEDFDSTSLKMGKILSANEPSEIIDNVIDLENEGTKIIERTTNILRSTVEKEIDIQVQNTESDPLKIDEALKKLKLIMNEKLLSREELSDLSYKAGLSFIMLAKDEKKYTNDLKEIMMDEKTDGLLRLRAAIAFVESLRKNHYDRKEILGLFDFNKLIPLIDSQKEYFDSKDLQQLTSLLG